VHTLTEPAGQYPAPAERDDVALLAQADRQAASTTIDVSLVISLDVSLAAMEPSVLPLVLRSFCRPVTRFAPAFGVGQN
jgi:hypothetical protein